MTSVNGIPGGIVLNDSLDLYNLTFNGNATSEPLFVTNNGHDLNVNGNLDLKQGYLANGTIQPKNTITLGAGFGHTITQSTIIPVGNVTVTNAETGHRFPNLVVNSGTTFNAPANTLHFGRCNTLTYNGGTFNHNSGTIEMTSVNGIP